MHHDEAREQITALLACDVRFEGHFDKCFSNLKPSQQEEIVEWVVCCRDKKASPIQSKNDRELIGFVKRIGSNVRALLTKKKNGYFIVLFLDKHKYYEEAMQKFGF